MPSRHVGQRVGTAGGPGTVIACGEGWAGEPMILVVLDREDDGWWYRPADTTELDRGPGAR
jgi:hypothetical protein